MFLEILGFALATLCLYAGLVWTLGHLALMLRSVGKKLRHKDDKD
jgi:hypothetical protein